MIDEKSLIEKIEKIFPDKIIYAQGYIKATGVLGFEIRKHAKERDMSSVQWLLSQGFTWKESGYIEQDMKRRQDPKYKEDSANALEIADHLFRCFPLAGEYTLTKEESEILYQAACDVVKKLLQKEGHATELERTILTASTIDLLKNWSTDQEDEGSNTFWNYIFLQYGFNAENPDAANAKSRLYIQFQKSIEGTLSRYQRFFASPATQRYYTSLLAHAIAPIYSIDRLFNILFSFYSVNLDYQYIPEDTSYQMFVKGMLARGSAEKKRGEDIKLRSDVLSAAQETLFRERPEYMAIVCDSIVRKMDAILRGEERDIMDAERNRWDMLLMDWYSKKSASEKVSLQGERKRRKTEYVATSRERIYVQYALRDSVVGIAVPRIRLPEVGDKRPYLTIYQGMDTIYEKEMSVSGNDLLLTTRSYFIPLSATTFDFRQAPDLRVEIEYIDEVLYESGRKLRCNYIVFDEMGNCRIPKNGTARIFAGEDSVVDFDGDEGVIQCNHPGQLYRVNLSQVLSVTVDGEELFVSQSAVGRIRHHAAIRRVPLVRACEDGQSADIFPEETTISVILPEAENIMKYQLTIDGARHPALQFQGEGNELIIPSASDDGKIHKIRVIDVETGQVKDEYLYTVKEGFKLEFDRSLYRPGRDDVGVTVNYQGGTYQVRLALLEDSYRARCVLPQLALDLEVHVPVVICSFLGKNAFTAENVIWYKDIPADEFTSLSLPSGWEGKLMLGVEEVPTVGAAERFDLGNVIRAMTNTPEELDLWLSLKSESGERINEKITTLRFVPMFIYAPIEVLEDQDLLWIPQGSFIGDSDTQFRITWTDHEHRETSYDVATGNLNLLQLKDYPKGNYQYKVYMKKKSLFSAMKEEELYCGHFTIGDPREFAFMGKELEFVKALCWNLDEEKLQEMQMKQNCGIAVDLTYIGDSVPPGETISVPCYSATLLFETPDGRRIPFSYKETDLFEEVNPVSIYIINEHLLILQSCTGDAVYVDSKYNSIVSKKPEAIMSEEDMRIRLKVPDYFEYVVREVNHHV